MPGYDAMSAALESLRIVAPVTSVADATRLLDAGARAFYCGAMFDDWRTLFGEADLVSRRQGRLSHLTHPKALYRVARFAADHRCKIALTLNARYTRLQQEKILDLVALWEDAGGHHLLIGDPALLFVLQQRKTSLKRHLSIMAGAFNPAAVHFFRHLGVSRIVLPRELHLPEIEKLVREAPEMEYEVLAMLQKCQFIDGMCGFYHGIRLPGRQAAVFDYAPKGGDGGNVATTLDPQYEGHGCQLDYHTDQGPVTHIHMDDHCQPHCAACRLPELHAAGVGFLKIAGRGYPIDHLVRVVGFVSAAIDIWRESDSMKESRARIRRRYQRSFGQACDGKRCYY